jgi:hypothetical protein
MKGMTIFKTTRNYHFSSPATTKEAKLKASPSQKRITTYMAALGLKNPQQDHQTKIDSNEHS